MLQLTAAHQLLGCATQHDWRAKDGGGEAKLRGGAEACAYTAKMLASTFGEHQESVPGHYPLSISIKHLRDHQCAVQIKVSFADAHILFVCNSGLNLQ